MVSYALELMMTRGIINDGIGTSEVNFKEDENNNNTTTINTDTTNHVISDTDNLTLYVRAGVDNRKYGACPFCQRIFMLLMLKQAQGVSIKFKVATVPTSRVLPAALKSNGLRNLPSIIHGDIAIDTVEEIIDYIDAQFPTKNRINDATLNESVDKLTRNFFSKFCFYIKSVSKDSSALVSELHRLDDLLRRTTTRFLLGDSLSHLDCEVLPKLHHVRVAASALKSLTIPSHLIGIWRYLNNAYNDDIFQKSCPPDQEIILHWASRPDTPKLSYDLYTSLTRNSPRFSFDVPAVAIPVNL